MKGILLLALANILNFIQIQGQFKYHWKPTNFLIASLGIPISYCYIFAIKYLVEEFNGKMWPSRLLSFAVGILIFSAMTKWWFNESPDLKSAISLILALAIVLLRL